MEDTCAQVDRFLMRNIEVKTKFLNRNSVKIRAPKELVDISDKYYIGCGFDNELKWKTQKGKKNKNYYFSTLPVKLNYIESITRVMDCCINYHEPSRCDTKISIVNWWDLFIPPPSNLRLGAEVGSHYENGAFLPYIGLALSKENTNQRVNMVLGTNTNLGLHYELNYQYHYLSLPFFLLNPASSWQTIGSFMSIHRYARLYLGTTSWIQYSNNTFDLNHNAYFGVAAVNTYNNATLSRVFLQGGLNANFNTAAKFTSYPFVQIGLNFNF